MRMRKKKWVEPFLENEKEYLVESLKGYDDERSLYVEIGMGMGDFITESAEMNPDIFRIRKRRNLCCQSYQKGSG